MKNIINKMLLVPITVHIKIHLYSISLQSLYNYYYFESRLFSTIFSFLKMQIALYMGNCFVFIEIYISRVAVL